MSWTNGAFHIGYRELYLLLLIHIIFSFYRACSILLAIGNVSFLLCHTLHQMIWVAILMGAANGIYLTMDTSLAVDTLNVDTVLNGEEKEHNQNNNVFDGYDNNAAEANSSVNVTLNNDNKNNTSQHHGAGQLFGFFGVFGFLGQSIGPLVGSVALMVFGYIPKTIHQQEQQQQQEQQSYGYSNEDGDGMHLSPFPFYKFQGYVAVFCLSGAYFFFSAVSLFFVQKKGV